MVALVTRPRVLLSFPTRVGTGGIGTTAWNQAAGLARVGVDVSIACGSVERALPGVRIPLETMRVAGRRIPFRVVGLDRAMAYHDVRTARWLRRNADGFDVVHAWPGGGPRTLAAARDLGVTTVLERPNSHTAFAYETVAEECRRLGISIDPTSQHRPNHRRLAREEHEFAISDALLCPSDFVLRTHAERGIAPERLVRHRYGYDPDRFPVGGPRDERVFTAVYVGLVEPRKGLHLALRAWIESGAAENGRFLVCGAIDQGYDAVLAPLLAHPSVEYLGHHPDPGAVMRTADVLVLPSLEEGSALVTYEARGSGCVLVVSDHSGAVASHGHDSLVHRAGDVEALREHLALLATDRPLLERLREASLARLGELTWDAAAHALCAAYMEVVLASRR